jgi:hypothetical protein
VKTIATIVGQVYSAVFSCLSIPSQVDVFLGSYVCVMNYVLSSQLVGTNYNSFSVTEFSVGNLLYS